MRASLHFALALPSPTVLTRRLRTRAQGTPGDNFYIVESGTFDVLVSRNGAPAVRVVSYTAGAAFGELALMYNAPRYVPPQPQPRPRLCPYRSPTACA